MDKQKYYPTGSSGGGGKKGYGAKNGGPYGLQEIRDNCRVSPSEVGQSGGRGKNKKKADKNKHAKSADLNTFNPTAGHDKTATNVSCASKVSSTEYAEDKVPKNAVEDINAAQKPVPTFKNIFISKKSNLVFNRVAEEHNFLSVKYKKQNVEAFLQSPDKTEYPFKFGTKIEHEEKISPSLKKDKMKDFVNRDSTENYNINIHESREQREGNIKKNDENLRGPNTKPTRHVIREEIGTAYSTKTYRDNDNNGSIELENISNVARTMHEAGLKYAGVESNTFLNPFGEGCSDQHHKVEINDLPAESLDKRCNRSKVESTDEDNNTENETVQEKCQSGTGGNNNPAPQPTQPDPRKRYNAQDKAFVYYIKNIEHSYKTGQGNMLSHLLSLRDSHVHYIIPMFKRDYTAIIKNECSLMDLSQALINHVECIKALLARNMSAAFNKQVAFSIFILHLLHAPCHRDETWTLPLLHELAIDIRVISLKAATTMSTDLNNKVLELGAEVLLGCFRICSFVNKGKIGGRLIISNELVKLFFEMKKYDYRQPLMTNAYDSSFKNLFKIYTQSHAEFTKLAYAYDYLTFAFENCPREYQPLINLILIRAEPLKIMKGQITPRNVLQQHGLTLFSDLSYAVHTGNLNQFEMLLRVYSSFFNLHGIFNFINVDLRALAEHKFRQWYMRPRFFP